MRFWDSSALVPLFVGQQASDQVRQLYANDPHVLTWILSDVEIRSAVLRQHREGALAAQALPDLLLRIDSFWQSVHVVSVIDSVKNRAKRLLGVHPLRAADSLQLGAALVTTLDNPAGAEFVSLDERLNQAARREGFAVIP